MRRCEPSRHRLEVDRVGHVARCRNDTTSDRVCTARVNRPRATGVPFHAASPTRWSDGNERDVDDGRLVVISS